MQQGTALVVGAGDLGGAVASLLTSSGWQVYGLRRHPDRLPPGVVGLAGDVTRPETLRALPRQVDAVVYAASADRRDEDAYRAVYVDGVRNVLDALGPEAAPHRRMVFVSTTAVYGDHGGAWVDETSDTAPDGFSGRVTLEGESIVRDRGPQSTTARLGGIYGPGRSRLLEQVRRGEATCPPGPPLYGNRIHRDDAAAAIVHQLALPEPPDVVNVVDDDPAPRCEVVRWLADRMGAPPPPSGPGPAARSGNKRVANARLRASGFALRYPSYRDGYAALIG